MTTVRVTYLGLDGEGPTVTAAKQDAARKAERALDGSYSPELLMLGDCTALVWREPRDGWHYQGLYPKPGKSETLYGTCGYNMDKEEAVNEARYMLCQLAWRTNMTKDQEEGIIAFASKAQRGQLRDWITFQRDYIKAINAGHTDQEAHLIAGHMEHLLTA